MRSEYKLIFERSKEGRRGYDLPKLDVPSLDGLVPDEMKAQSKLDLPEIAEIDLVRHYTNLSRRNFGVDNGFYPLGSCTMKYNPKINEELPALFSDLHPLMDTDLCQGALDMMYHLDKALCEITGMDKFTLSSLRRAHTASTPVL